MILTKRYKKDIISKLTKIFEDKDFDKNAMFEFYISNDLIFILDIMKQRKIVDAEDIECLVSTIDNITFLQEKYLG